MRTKNFFAPFFVLSFFLIGIIGCEADTERYGDAIDGMDIGGERASITGQVEPAGIAATVHVKYANNDFEQQRPREGHIPYDDPREDDALQDDQLQEDEFQDDPMREDDWAQEGDRDREDAPQTREQIVASVEVDQETGAFEIRDLEPGTYIVEIEPHDQGYDRKEVEEVHLDRGEEKDLGEISLDNDEGADPFGDHDPLEGEEQY
jgi:hypothetical protein